ncbi:Cyclic nucleotide-gated cation channel [Holothuria leucospilota]|uniref:Cyclic nucleotide-gated cation channel n=1 Tax=Holothuria leucospilota TaxID=206669 RepID=A0A9Q1CIX5_HOLLE|nr:Cyclic nucleotide-gated cation channel [Holothuria leucospilota]
MSSSIFWFIDTICDVIYLLDIGVNLRMGYLEQGLLVVDPRKLSQNYCKKFSFRMDLLCLLPIGKMVPTSDYFPSTTYRLNRLLKMYALETFFAVWDSRTSNPNRHRATKLTFYLAGVIHWTGCIYFMVSMVRQIFMIIKSN